MLIEQTNLFRIKFECQVFQISEAVAQRCPVKKAFLKILQNSLKNIRAAVFTLIKFQAKGL